MDSITHLFLGGAIAAAIAPARYRRAALFAGAFLNSLPDIDVLPLAFVDDPVSVMVWHRSATHSLLLLPLLGALLWHWLRVGWKPSREAPWRWFWLVQATLLTHPLVDAFTIYGTQLWWPVPTAPSMWASLFIIDPLFTLPLALACVLGWTLNQHPAGPRVLFAGLALSCAYLVWSQVAKQRVDAVADRTLAPLGLQSAPRFSVPMPFNTLLWRVVVMTPDGFMEGDYSLVADHGPMKFRSYRSDRAALAEVAGLPSVRRLLWFTHGFVKVEEREGKLVLSDLRMGAEPDYSFRFAVARRVGHRWRPLPVEQLRWPWAASRRLPGLWRRIWQNPADAEAP